MSIQLKNYLHPSKKSTLMTVEENKVLKCKMGEQKYHAFDLFDQKIKTEFYVCAKSIKDARKILETIPSNAFFTISNCVKNEQNVVDQKLQKCEMRFNQVLFGYMEF